MVAGFYPGFGGGFAGQCLGYVDRHAHGHGHVVLALGGYLADKVVADGNHGVEAVANHAYARTWLQHVPLQRVVGGIEGSPVEAHQAVAVAEACFLQLFAEVHALGHCLEGNHVVAPVEGDADIDAYCENEVEHHACHHDAQPLPCRLRAQFPRLGL